MPISDMITAAVEQQPSTFKDHFNAAIMDRVYDALQAKKVEVASTMFDGENSSSQAAPEETEEENGQNA